MRRHAVRAPSVAADRTRPDRGPRITRNRRSWRSAELRATHQRLVPCAGSRRDALRVRSLVSRRGADPCRRDPGPPQGRDDAMRRSMARRPDLAVRTLDRRRMRRLIPAVALAIVEAVYGSVAKQFESLVVLAVRRQQPDKP